MITSEEIQHMANLVRLEVSSDMQKQLASEMSDIVGYVSQVQELATKAGAEELREHRNIFREDGIPHESGLYTEDILHNTSKVSSDGAIVTPKIL